MEVPTLPGTHQAMGTATGTGLEIGGGTTTGTDGEMVGVTTIGMGTGEICSVTDMETATVSLIGGFNSVNFFVRSLSHLLVYCKGLGLRLGLSDA